MTAPSVLTLRDKRKGVGGDPSCFDRRSQLGRRDKTFLPWTRPPLQSGILMSDWHEATDRQDGIRGRAPHFSKTGIKRLNLHEVKVS